MSCRYDRTTDTYLIDDQPCRTDTYGDPTFHCTARRTCPHHIAPHEQTCARCLGRTRQDIHQTTLLATLMPATAIDNGTHTPAAHLAAPAANPEHTRATRFWVHGHATHHYRQGRLTEATYTKILSDLPDEDTWHPHSVVTRWQLQLSEDYNHPLPTRYTTTGACTYLTRHLTRIAQDPHQDFAQLARDMRHTRQRLETTIHDSSQPERGAPCPTCLDTGHLVRLIREYPHYCDQPDCERIHHTDDTNDLWRCPHNRTTHYWTHAWYTGYLEDRMYT